MRSWSSRIGLISREAALGKKLAIPSVRRNRGLTHIGVGRPSDPYFQGPLRLEPYQRSRDSGPAANGH